MENANKAPRAFRAYAKNHSSMTADTPKEAAEAFFTANPSARKCNVTEGQIEVTDGREFFVTAYGRENCPQSWKDVTKKTAGALVDAKADGAKSAAETFAQGVRDAGYKV
jgi:hypothetical protein